MRVLYLYSGSRKGVYEKVKSGEHHGNGYWGMLDLPKFGIETDYIEPEHFFSGKISKILRRYLSVYIIHGLFFWKFFSYDYIFTSTAFGTQLIHAVCGIKKPRWVMYDFGIDGLLGEEKTWKQKIFKFTVARSAGIVTLSSYEKNYLEEKFPEKKGKIAHIPYGVNLKFFTPKNVSEVRQVFAVGHDPDRDWKTFFEAVKGLPVPVVVATWEKRIEHLRPLPDNVTVHTFSDRELVEEYTKSAVVVVPLNSRKGNNNAMGCSVMCEALSVGRPLIITRTRTTESYITHGQNGFLVEEGSVSEMRQAILDVLADQSLRQKLSANARKYSLDNLDSIKTSQKLADFFKKL